MARRSKAVELGARARAARAYAGIERRDIAKKLGMSDGNYGKIEAGASRALKLEELQTIADTTKVPLRFLEDGFPADDQSLEDRLAELEGHVDRLYLHIIQEQAAADVPARRRLRFPPGRQQAPAAPRGKTRRAR